MTTYELMHAAGQHPGGLAMALGGPVLVALALQLGPQDPRGNSLWAYAWSLVVYLSSVPGMLAAAVLLYSVALPRHDLLKLDLLTTALPVLGMVATLSLAHRKVRLGELPGVDRLGGFLMLLAVTMVSLIAIDRLRIAMVFHGSFWQFLGLGVGLFVAFKLGLAKLFGKRPEARRLP